MAIALNGYGCGCARTEWQIIQLLKYVKYSTGYINCAHVFVCVCVSVILKIPRFTLSVKSQRFMYLFRLPFIRFISSIFFSLFKSVGFFFASSRLSSTVVSLLHKLCLSHAHTHSEKTQNTLHTSLSFAARCFVCSVHSRYNCYSVRKYAKISFVVWLGHNTQIKTLT